MSSSIKDKSTSDASYSEDSHPNEIKEENQKGQEDRTLVGSSVSKSFNDVTAFTSEGRVVTRVYDTPREDLVMFTTVHPSEEVKHSIEEFMSRAIKLTTIQFSASQTAGSLITTRIDVMDTLRSAAGFDVIRNKMRNFYGARFTAKLRITLNPQPFESGMFQIFFIPMMKTMAPIVPIESATILNACKLPFATSCPNVLCNISTQSEVELAVPYTGPSPFINLSNSAADFGAFFVQSIVPIADSTNNANCDLSVYMSFHDVTLFGAAPAFLPAGSSTLPSASSTGTIPQMMQPPREEAQMKQKGPISNIASNLIPLLDSLGLSAPTANLNPSRVSIAPYASPANADTVKNAFKVSYLAAHQLNISPIGIDNADEMDINYILSKPTYHAQFQWRSADQENAKLFTFLVEPNCSLVQSKDKDYIVNAPSRLRFLANAFRFWRGTIKLYVHVVANKFHSGRLRFNYVLGPFNTGVDILQYFPQTFTHVVDLRDATNFCIDLPYFATSPWRVIPQDISSTSFRYEHSSFEQASAFYDPPAILEIVVENQLRYSPSTSSSLQVVLMTAGGDDFQFAVPIAPTSVPTTTFIKPSVVKKQVFDNVRIATDFIKTVARESDKSTIERPSLDQLPQEDFNRAASEIYRTLGAQVTTQHLVYYGTHDPRSPEDIGLFESFPDPQKALALLQLAPYLKKYYENYSRLRSKTSSTGTRPQALDMEPINIVSPSQTLPQVTDPAPATVGEKITSIRQLIKRYQQVGGGEITLTAEDKRPVYVFAPFYIANPSSENQMSSDLLSYFYSMFRFYRGSIRHLIASNCPSSQFTVKYDPTYIIEPSYSSTNPFGNRICFCKVSQFPTGISFDSAQMTAIVPYNFNLQGSLEVEFPYYNRFPKVFTQYWTGPDKVSEYGQSTYQGYTPLGLAMVEINNFEIGGNVTVLKFLRAAADDFNFGYMLGPPLCRVNATLTS